MKSTYMDPSSKRDSSQEVVDLIERDPRVLEKPGPFEFWYRLTAPPRQPLTASFEQREAARKGQLTSTILTAVAGSLVILAVPTSFAIHDSTLLIVLCVLLTIVAIALFLNRTGRGLWGRILVVIAMNISLAISIITWPGGLTMNTLPVFDIMIVEPTLVALALLPPSSVFIVALFNVAFIGLDFYLEPHATDLIRIMQFDSYEVVTRPIYLLIFVIAVVYPVMRNTLRAIALGDRAKEIAKVQHDLAEQEAQIVQEKQQLDESINQLVDTLVQAANGNSHVRAVLPEASNLRRVAGSINMLLARVRRAMQSEYELQQTRKAANALISALHQSRRTNQPMQIKRTGNAIVDEILMELVIDHHRTYPLSQSLNLKQWNETDQSTQR